MSNPCSALGVRGIFKLFQTPAPGGGVRVQCWLCLLVINHISLLKKNVYKLFRVWRNGREHTNTRATDADVLTIRSGGQVTFKK